MLSAFILRMHYSHDLLCIFVEAFFYKNYVIQWGSLTYVYLTDEVRHVFTRLTNTPVSPPPETHNIHITFLYAHEHCLIHRVSEKRSGTPKCPKVLQLYAACFHYSISCIIFPVTVDINIEDLMQAMQVKIVHLNKRNYL